MSRTLDDLRQILATTTVPVLWPKEFTAVPEVGDRRRVLETHFDAFDFRRNPSVDFGRLEERIPWFVLAPRSLPELILAVELLARERIPWKQRGTGHSSGGQTLTGEGCVFDLRGLDRIVADHPDEALISVEGGVTWLALFEHLEVQGRRPLVLTDNLRTTVGGTVAVGGFGDASHLHKLQANTVVALTLVAPNGSVHRLTPPDPLFSLVLCGRGLLGVIAEVTLRTERRPATGWSCVVSWPTVEDYVDDGLRVADEALAPLQRARLFFTAGGATAVRAVLAGHAEPTHAAVTEIAGRPSRGTCGPVRPAHFGRGLRYDPASHWRFAVPALELVLPVGDGLALWRSLAREIRAAGLVGLLPEGVSTLAMRPDRTLPLAPFPDDHACLLVAIRPHANPAVARALVPLVRDLARRALEGGGRLYLMSVEPTGTDWLRRQLGSHLAVLGKRKRQLDPDDLCHRGFLPAVEATER